MAISHSTTARNAMADACLALLDGGDLVFLTAADAEVARLPFSPDAFPAASGGSSAANPLTPDGNTSAGTIAKFEARNSSDAAVISGVVATSGADINLSSVVADAGGSLSISSLVYNASP